jgi:flavin reductase (DIM6/NTAB) family NADH-FMN oxidoreductase RutF
MRFELAQCASRDVYQLLTRCVAPRPIAFVSTLSPAGEPNLAPFSYFNLGGLKPPSVVFCPVNDREGRVKDTLYNIEHTREYVIHVVTREIAAPMNLTSFAYPRGVNEFLEAGFTPVPSVMVRAPRVAESPVAMECRLYQIVTHGDGPLAGNYVIGEVLLIDIRDDLLDAAGLPDPARMGLIGRMGGDFYVDTISEALFELHRPTARPERPPDVGNGG